MDELILQLDEVLVSIHAPARRATRVDPGRPGDQLVSIHAPARRATSAYPCSRRRPRGFNPRPRTEGDAVCRDLGLGLRQFQSTPPHGGRLPGPQVPQHRNGVSIHAPARRATSPDPNPRRRPRSFNPRPRTEGDEGFLRVGEDGKVFQSTPPHGGRPSQPARPAPIISVSIHAPARRATLPAGPAGADHLGFNPRPRTEGDSLSWLPRLQDMFQSTPPHGGRRS